MLIVNSCESHDPSASVLCAFLRVGLLCIQGLKSSSLPFGRHQAPYQEPVQAAVSPELHQQDSSSALFSPLPASLRELMPSFKVTFNRLCAVEVSYSLSEPTVFQSRVLSNQIPDTLIDPLISREGNKIRVTLRFMSGGIPQGHLYVGIVENPARINDQSNLELCFDLVPDPSGTVLVHGQGSISSS